MLMFNHIVNQCVRDVLVRWVGANEADKLHLTTVKVDEFMNNDRILKIVISRNDIMGTCFFSGVIDSYGNVHREAYGTLRSVGRDTIAEINRLCCGVIRDQEACSDKDGHVDTEVDTYSVADDEFLIRGCSEEEYDW